MTPDKIIAGLSRLALWELLETGVETEDWPPKIILA